MFDIVFERFPFNSDLRNIKMSAIWSSPKSFLIVQFLAGPLTKTFLGFRYGKPTYNVLKYLVEQALSIISHFPRHFLTGKRCRHETTCKRIVFNIWCTQHFIFIHTDGMWIKTFIILYFSYILLLSSVLCRTIAVVHAHFFRCCKLQCYCHQRAVYTKIILIIIMGQIWVGLVTIANAAIWLVMLLAIYYVE